MKNVMYENRSQRPLFLAVIAIIAVFLLLQSTEGNGVGDGDKEKKSMSTDKYNSLTPEEEYVILRKGTERPNSGKYTNNKSAGIYTCKRCDAPLYDAKDKFDSNCGWPSFDDEIYGAVKRLKDADGRRTEIICANCDGHLGHVFLGEGFTKKDTRHCVNSISMSFVPKEKTETAIFASGCFWGTEYHFKKKKGVLLTSVGYIGGHKDKPTYREVCSGKTGHAEAVKVVFDPAKVSYEDLTKLYFETHNPTQVNRQGPDIGEQYRSEIFYFDENQKETAQKLIDILKTKGLKVATRLTPTATFWKGEDYHQDYYDKKRGTPYCHIYTKRF
jgi:peptide methionine sulfoxide reductase msrA/msrB